MRKSDEIAKPAAARSTTQSMFPSIAHVRDVRKGLVTLYTEENEITIKNKRLAAALFHATH